MEVPRGKVTTYGAIAKALAKRNSRWSPKSARAVGTAMKNNPCAPKIPCHRVIKSDGSLGQFMGGAPEGIKRKKTMLEGEGIIIKNGKINLEEFSHAFEL
ncbi:MAG: methylated-DNA--[protein]-cysteine S-methyltransferase [Candidatus Heimdallarchaeota archaeon]|nr:methylated-DNA--[protein]-cysteine S-methyltransferase [Candidatus Heimdallarchaeota archaeon]